MSDEGATRRRRLSPPMSFLVKGLATLLIVAGALYALEVHLYLRVALYMQQFLGLLLALVLPIVFISFPPRPSRAGRGVPWYDLLMAVLGGVCGLYVALWYPKVADFIQFPSADKYVLGSIVIILVLEASRRLFGPLLPAIAAVFVLYAGFADYFPGPLRTGAIPWMKLAGELFLSSNGMLGIAMEILATVVLVFMVFGSLMLATGGGSVFSDLAMTLMGRFRGGPAKVAVLSSAMFGSISGSGVANVAVTGTVTIPLMKRLGYRPEVAAAVEATSSTGGMILPPVMGAVAFIMAEYLQVPYREIVIAAFIPALLYYAAVLIQVDLEAGRIGLKGLPPELIPGIWKVLRQSWPFLLPIPVLLYTLIALNWQPARAGMFATLMVVVVGFWNVRHKGVAWWFNELAKAGMAISELCVIGALVGLIIGASDLTGLGFSLSLPLVQIGENNRLLFLLITALVSLILGMGLPGIVIYIMQTALIVPPLVKMGIAPIAAHFFIMYFGTFSMITPPVALSVMAAAAIARSNQMQTGWEAVKLGVIAFIVPFMFVLSPSLLFQGDLLLVLINTVTAGVGVVGIGVGFRGFFYSAVGPLGRTVLLACAAGLLLPVTVMPLAWAVNTAALVVTIVILAANYSSEKKRATRPV